MSTKLRLFAYGSLIYEPELPEALIDSVPGRWEGTRRSFNKISFGRGCLVHESSAPVVTDFVRGNRRLSLVLGTEPGDGLHGFVLRYPESAATEVLRRVNIREGTDYVETEIEVALADGQVKARTWVTNPHCASYLGDLADDRVASILRHATPDRVGSKAQGIAYLEGVRAALTEVGLRDDYLDGVSLAIRNA